MSDLRDSLRKAAGGEPPAGDAFARFEMARRRSSIVRGLVVLGLGLAIISSFLWVFPNPFTSGAPADLQPGGTLDPTLRNVREYRDPVAGFALLYPADWVARGTAGEPAEFFVLPPGSPRRMAVTSLSAEAPFVERPDTFYVRVTPLPTTDPASGLRTAWVDDLARAGVRFDEDVLASPDETQVRSGQLQARFPVEPRDAATAPYWCGGCMMQQSVVSLRLLRDGFPSLLVRIVAPNPASFDAFASDARRLVDSIERYVAPPD